MNAGTVSNLISCGILIAGLSFAFWFTAVLPDRERRAKKQSGPAAKSIGKGGRDK
ncbi:hypothetical protein [Burkholderia cepacia]|uniref:hypothetical protein n=1 Tax=Burkholderia cepacia TaxID=292 RepID=UPI001CF4D19B|nr:hypothetical protein [Burkholderia cepacia]MCA8058519.1 hypothetical protein [Burkholderia cepacia]